MGSRLIGRSDETSFVVFPDLGTIMICARSNDIGQ